MISYGGGTEEGLSFALGFLGDRTRLLQYLVRFKFPINEFLIMNLIPGV